MKCKKILSTILATLLITNSSGITVFAETVNKKIATVNTIESNSERTTLFNDGWVFNLGDVQGAKEKNFDDSNWEKLSLPHDWSIELDFNSNSESTHEGGYLDGGTGWYRKTFTLPSEMEGKKLSIDFEGVYMDSYVYVNGVQVGNHPYGYTPFSFDITENLVCDGVTENVIAVKVNNKQASSRWYSGSGIYRDVKLTVTDKVHVDQYGTYVTTPNLSEEYSTGMATVNVKTDIVNEESVDREVQVISAIYDNEGKKVAEKTNLQIVLKGNKLQFNDDIVVNNPQLWSTINPYLYNIVTTVMINNEVVDEYETEFGIRWFEFTSDNGFYLNGEQMKLEGVCMHHDQGALGAVDNEAAIRRQVKKLKEMGVNSIRVTHNPASQHLIDICNEEGILLIEEAFDTWYSGKKTYDYGRFFEQKSIHGDMTWAEFDIKQMVNRGKNAPSIIAWSIGNEIRETAQTKGVQTATNLNKWVKEIDSTRPTTMGEDKFRSGTGEGQHEEVAKIVDLVGFNYAEDKYDKIHSKYSDWNLYGSETSSATRSRGIYRHPGTSTQMTKYPDLQQSSYDNDYVSWGKTAEEAWKRDRDRGYIAGEYIWTGFDYIGEPTPYYSSYPSKSSYFGAIDTAGFEKDIFYFYQSQWSDSPMVHLLPHWSWENDDSIKVDGNKILMYAYTNANSVDLYYNSDVNSEELGELVASDRYEVTSAGYNGKYKETEEGKLHLEFKVEYKPGKITAVAKDENGKEIARDIVKTANEAKKVNLSADRQVIEADGYDLSYITVDIVDENGTLVPTADNLIDFEISGNGKIVGVDNGNAASVERYKDTKRQAFSGKALVIVQSTKDAGSFTLTANSNGLSSDSINIYTVEEGDLEENKIVGYDVNDVTVPINGELNLPSTVTAVFANEEKQEVDVTWDKVSADKLSKAGVFNVNGKVNGSEITVSIRVIVKDIIGILDTRILVPVGIVESLPTEVSAVFNDGSIEKYPVEWDKELSKEDVSNVGTIEIEGLVTGLSSLKAKAIVVVSENSVENNIAKNDGTTYPKPFATYVGSDPVSTINDGVVSQSSTPKNRWTNWGKSSQDFDDYVGIEFSESYYINKIGIALYSDSGVALPSEIIVEYFDGSNWVPVSNQSKKNEFTGVGVEQITFDTVNTNKIRVLLKEDTSKNKAVGLTELLVYSKVLKIQGTALLQEIKVNGESLEGFKENTESYTINLPYGNVIPEVTATAKDNASIFVIPALTSNSTTKILVIAEDGKLEKTYYVKFKENDPILNSATISLGKGELLEDNIIDLIVDAKLQSGNSIDMNLLDIKYNVVSESGAEAKIIDNKLYLYKAGDIDIYADVTYKGVTKKTNIISTTILENTEEKTIISYEKVIVETEKGVIPKLPEKVKATFDIGLPKEVKVKWDKINEEDYNKYGIFEVDGTVEGQELKVIAKVVVKGVSAVENISVATNIKVEPTLPTTLKVYSTDGTVKNSSVIWNQYDKGLLNNEGEFTITGVVEGIDIEAKANVRVTNESIIGDNIAGARNGYDLPMAIASYTNDTSVSSSSKDSITKVNDNVIEHDPNATNNRWCNWKKTNMNTTDWVGIIFGTGVAEKKYIDNLNIDYFEDSGTKIPSNVVIQYYVGDEITLPKNPAHVAKEESSPLNDDNNWIDVTNLVTNPEEISGLGTNVYTFDKVKTYALRVKMTAQSNMALAITEIKAFEEKVVSNTNFDVNTIKVNDKDLEGFAQDILEYSLILENDEKLPSVTVDATNNASSTVIYKVESSETSKYAVNNNELIEVIINSEDGLKEVKYTINVERKNPEVEVDKLLLQYAVEYAEEAKLDGALEDVVPIVVKEFNEALEEAKLILADPDATEAQVDASFNRLINAIWMLEYKKGDKEALKDMIDLAEGLNEKQYTEETWVKLQDKLELAKAVYEDENALKDEVEKASHNLQNAINELIKKNVDKIKLKDLVNVIEKLEESEYIKTTWENLQDNLKNSKDILTNEDAIQKEVDESYNNLMRAYLNLRLKPSKDKLNELINKAESLNKENYTLESWNKLDEVLNNAKTVFDNEDSTQEEVSNAEKSLKNAINNLALSENDKKDDVNSSNNGAISEDNNSNNNTNVGKGSNDINLPNTGAMISSAVVATIAVIIVAVGVILLRKKKEKK
ncbi:Ig-like domain-containing protein [Clostridium tertium]